MSNQTRRAILKKLAYVAPAILTLPAFPAFAGRGSGKARWIEKDAKRWTWEGRK